MDDLEVKLNSNNPFLVGQIFSKITEEIKKKHESLKCKESFELKFLKEKCLSHDPLVSEVAGTGIIKLVEDEVLDIETTLAEFITTIPLTRCYSTLIRVIGNLLYIEMKKKESITKAYQNSFNLSLPQHPYITILNENPNSWTSIFNDIKYWYQHKENCNLLSKLFRPVYLYLFFNPTAQHVSLFKQRVWSLLLRSSNEESQIFYDILCWMHVQGNSNLEINSELIIDAITYTKSTATEILNLELLLLWQVSILHNLVLNKLDIRPTVYNLKNVLTTTPDLVTVNCLVYMLSRTLYICSPVHLLDLVDICMLLVSYKGLSSYVLEVLKASLLQWLANPCLLTEEGNKIANDIFKYIETYETNELNQNSLSKFLKEFQTVISSNSDVFVSMQICLLDSKENKILEFLEKFENTLKSPIKNVVHFLFGLFLMNNTLISSKAFSIILRCTETNILLTTPLLILILYKLSNTVDPTVHFELLRALPKMLVLMENIPKVMATLQALSNGSTDLRNLITSLMFEAWKVNPKCYSYLEDMLTKYNVHEKKWETYVTKAYILKEICHRKPELYGKDMVAHLSKVLNECNADNGSLPSALAIEGIRLLCKAEVIDIITTWTTLSPKFTYDRRVKVIKSVCSLISEIPRLPYTESEFALNEEVVKKLWEYVKFGDPAITEAALDALTSFSLEQICAQLPEEYLDDNLLHERQHSVVGTPQYVPGKTWLKFLTHNGASKVAGDFLIKMISLEVEAYLKYVYQVKGPKEPLNYGYLPTYSIVRGIGEFVKTWAGKWQGSIHDLLFIECLRILSVEYSKPLPPLDWCFLQELVHEPRTRDYCVDIASHQVILSGTARRLVENYVVVTSQNPKERDISNIFRNLKHLANSIQPVILKPFLENSLAFVIGEYNKDSGSGLLPKVLGCLECVLRNGNIQDTNKITMAQVLSDIVSVEDVGSGLFKVLLPCIVALPKQQLEEMTCLKSGACKDLVEKMTKIRCAVALNTSSLPLNWLNEIIEVGSTMERNPEITKELIAVFRKHISNPTECAMWLLELIGQIQAKVADRCETKTVTYYFDVMILTVVEFSGCSPLINDCDDYELRTRELFPQAFVALLEVNEWSVCTIQALEWLYHMNTEETISIDYRKIFGSTLQALRHDEEYFKSTRWMKYLNSNCTFT